MPPPKNRFSLELLLFAWSFSASATDDGPTAPTSLEEIKLARLICWTGAWRASRTPSNDGRAVGTNLDKTPKRNLKILFNKLEWIDLGYLSVSDGTMGNWSSSESSIWRFLRPAQVGDGTAAKLFDGTQRTTDARVVTVDVRVKVAVLKKGLLTVLL